MKKIAFILMPFLLVSCFGEKDKIEDAKREALGDDVYKEVVDLSNLPDNIGSNPFFDEEDNDSSTPLYPDVPFIKEEKISPEEIFTFPNLPSITYNTKAFSLKWFISWEFEVDRITVDFSNKTSSYPDDHFELGKFKSWDSTFEYNANFEPFNVLDYGLNEYVITAYIGEKSFAKKLIVNIPKQESEEKKSSSEEISLEKDWEYKWFDSDSWYQIVNFPEDNLYWSVVELQDGEFMYSKVEDFKINSTDNINLSCDNISEYLISKYWYIYWNTCRPLTNNNWLFVNVLRIQDDKYSYFRYYYDSKNTLEWIKELDSGTGINKENISDKNKEFKDKDFSRFTILSDMVFKDLTK